MHTMNYVLKLHQKFSKYPFGDRLFSWAVAKKAPYFLSIKPKIDEIRTNYIKVSMPKRRAVHNHLKTVHAIAMCNLCEFAGGICMEASIPKHRRWIPVGMEVKYLRKAKTNLTAVCDLGEPDWDRIDHQMCDVKVKDSSGEIVMTAMIEMKVSDKKNKSKA